MTKLEKLKCEISAWRHENFWPRAAGIGGLRATRRDEEMARDFAADKFDGLAEAARAAIATGRVTPLLHIS